MFGGGPNDPDLESPPPYSASASSRSALDPQMSASLQTNPAYSLGTAVSVQPSSLFYAIYE